MVKNIKSEILENINNLCICLDNLNGSVFLYKKYKIIVNIEICEVSNFEIKKFLILYNNKKIANIGIEYNGDLIFHVKGVLDWQNNLIEENEIDIYKLNNLYKNFFK